MPYLPRRAARSDFVELRNLRFHIQRWPGTDPEPVVLLHGFQDAAQTFQFVADHLDAKRNLIAPDLRGFGRSQWGPPGGYWFADYVADVDAILDRVAPERSITLIGHSMGGNIAGLYAGIRPERVRRLVLLEGFGLRRTQPEDAPARYRQWLAELQRDHAYSIHESYETFAAALMSRNSRLSAERADFIARAWGEAGEDGRVKVRCDPAHKMVSPVLYRREEAEACWAAITVPTLLIIGNSSNFSRWAGDDATDERLLSNYRNAVIVRMEDAGHMMHHEQPETVAAHIERFLAANEQVRGKE